MKTNGTKAQRSGAAAGCVAVALTVLAAAPAAAADLYREAAWRDKVEPHVLAQLDDARSADFIVYLGEQADLSAAEEIHGKARKGRFVFERLRETARRTQRALLAELEAAGVEHRAFWAVNAVWVKGDRELLERVAARPEVERVLANPRVSYERPVRDFVAKRQEAVLWHLADTRVPEVFWAAGIRGEGVVVAGQDTGYDWEHPALQSRYRGVQGNRVDHNYNWHDAIHSGGGTCGTDSPVPCDDDDHGTHTMGTMVGETPDNEFGLAPDAKWIGCRNMDQGVGTPATYMECTEWLIAPTDLNDENPDPGKAPDVINNSWGCTPGEGCGDTTILRQTIENARAAGILFVVSAGNSGPDCGSISAPPAVYDAALTVAATAPEGVIADFSSRGPVTIDGSGRMKPDIAAPGVRVFSSTPKNNYALLQGTSMASPHVAGMAALVLSAGRCMRGDVDALEQHLIAHAAPHKDALQECGGLSGQQIPNPIFGAGDLRAAMPDCPSVIHGAADGMKGIKVVCKDRSGGGKASNRVAAGAEWSCDGGTFAPEPGDKIQIRLSGKAQEVELLGGTAFEVDLQKVTCKNQKTRKSVKAALVGEGEWDCSALDAGKNDKIIQTLVGQAI